VPPHRIAPLKKHWIKMYTPIVEHLKLHIRFNTRAKAVELRVRDVITIFQILDHDDDMICRPPRKPHRSPICKRPVTLFRPLFWGLRWTMHWPCYDWMICMWKHLKSKMSKHCMVIIYHGPLVGWRVKMERPSLPLRMPLARGLCLQTRSFWLLLFILLINNNNDRRIHILGSFQNIKIARDAICALILGSPPGKVYANLRTVAHRMRERFWVSGSREMSWVDT